jgi:hypothetical protein
LDNTIYGVPMRKKHKTVSATSIRLSAYENYSKERMDTIIKRLDDLTVEVKDLRTDVSMGKGVIAFLVVIGSIAGSIIGFFQFKS